MWRCGKCGNGHSVSDGGNMDQCGKLFVPPVSGGRITVDGDGDKGVSIF